MALISIISLFLVARAEDHATQCFEKPAEAFGVESESFFNVCAADIALKFEEQGFTCKGAAQKAQFLDCVGRVGTYPRPVHFFVPKTIQGKSPLSLAFHFHGYLPKPPDTVFTTFDFGKFVVDSGTNTVLVVPESEDRDRTYNDFFNSDKSFSDFFSAADSVVKNTIKKKSDSILLTGHSGAYTVLSKLSKTVGANPKEDIFKKIKAVGFFDCAYGAPENEIADWAQRLSGSEQSFFSVFIPGTPPGHINERVMGILKSRNVGYRVLDSAAASNEKLSGVSFVREIKATHNGTVLKYYSKFLIDSLR